MSTLGDTVVGVQGVGLVTAVGQSAPASCAAFRAKLSNPSETRFTDGAGQWILAHQVVLEKPWRGLTKLARMAAQAIEEALRPVPRAQWARLPMVLCVAEPDRPGRLDALDEPLAATIQEFVGVRFDPAHSAIVAHGRVGLAVALNGVRRLLASTARNVEQVVVVAADSLIARATVGAYESEGRLLTERNSNGFMPGEAAGALLLGRVDGVSGRQGQLAITGLGFAREAAHIASEEPLRGEGLTAAVRGALGDAGLAMHDMDYRIADLSGEHYYFKEASLVLSRTLRQRKESFDLWHPAECAGELGAASGVAMLALAEAACAKGYTPGPRILAHWANDNGHRAAATLQWLGSGSTTSA
jgi:3-oxoacyl-[acyl-carrier-protein] synthase I